MKIRISLLLITLGLLAVVIAMAVRAAEARPAETTALQASPMHPTFAMLDEQGENVLTSGQPVSSMKTCGQCHDTDFIAGHSYHADLGLSEYKASDQSLNGTVGAFGKWNPFAYRFLSKQGDPLLDMSTAEWLKLFGAGQVGGGPATTSREGGALTSLAPDAKDPEASILDPSTGKAVAWDWSQSGSIEMNCFLCHFGNPDNNARTQAIQNGQFAWANTATLLATGIVSQSTDGLSWNKAAFDANGNLLPEYITVQDPSNENCAQCHQMAHTEQQPLVLDSCDAASAPTGEIISEQRISDSGMNLDNKESLARSWDIHAERQLQCTDCHFSLNNPAKQLDVTGQNPAHLTYDPRRLDIGEYLKQPEHDFARGQSAQYNVKSRIVAMSFCEPRSW